MILEVDDGCISINGPTMRHVRNERVDGIAAFPVEWRDEHGRCCLIADFVVDDRQRTVRIKYRGGEQIFEFDASHQGHKLKCPVTGEPTDWIHFERGFFRTEGMWGLASPPLPSTQKRSSPTIGSSMSPRPIGKVQRLSSKGRRKALAVQKYSWTEEQRANFHLGRKLKLARRRTARESECSSESALQRGQKVIKSSDSKEVIQRILSAYDDLAYFVEKKLIADPINLGSLPPSVPLGIWEDHCRIDIRVLARTSFHPEELGLAILDWSESSHSLRVEAAIDLKDPERPSMILEWAASDGELRYQAITLKAPEQNGRNRWAVVCPVTRKTVEVIAFRYGRFASRQAQRLVNRSQRAQPRSSIKK